MTTRRTTRRSTANGTTGINNDENDLISIGSSTTLMQVNGKAIVGIKSKNATNNNNGGLKIEAGVKASTSTNNATRKRTAFNDVTNESKPKITSTSNNNNGSKLSIGIKKPVIRIKSDSTTVTASNNNNSMARRTRSSTGGIDEDLKPSIKHEDSDQISEQEQEVEDEDSAMEQEEDGQETVVVVAPRIIKQLRRSSATTANSNPKQPLSNTVAATKIRRPLESKSTNSTTTTASTSQLSRPTHSTKAKATLTTRAIRPVVNSRVRSNATSAKNAEALKIATARRQAAEASIKLAQEELELARIEEEAQALHKDKKARTSPSFGDYSEEDGMEEDEEEEEEEGDEVDVAAENQVGLMKVKDVAVVRPKDFGWEDLDDGDEEDPLMVSSYVVEVYDYLKELELTTMPDVDYMTNQNEVTWKMRGILIDWLVEIHTKFRLLPETIFLATNIVDRFLSSRIVSLVKFQLVGVTALFIASKYEEVVCPSVSNFLYMTDGGYEDDEILKAERYVLSTIEFNLSYPNPINFLRRISKADGYDISSRTMAKYLMEISIVDHKFMGITPSLIAAAGNWLARKVLGKGSWHANLVHYSGYTEEELKPTAQLMLNYVVRNSNLANLHNRSHIIGVGGNNPLQISNTSLEPEHPNFIKKYAGKKFFKASTTMKQWAESEFAPIEFTDPKTKKTVTKFVPALL